MFTILNIINYFTGKYIPLIVLILITIGIYYYVISQCFNDIFYNDYYLVMLLILMLLDITSLIVIFIYGDFLCEDAGDYSDMTKKLKKNKKDKKNKKNKKDNKDKKNKKDDDNAVPKSNANMLNISKEIISLYDNNKQGSINTFVKFQ